MMDGYSFTINDAKQSRAMFDGLANVMTGTGTTIDPRTQNRWLRQIMSEYEVEEAYRGSWLMRKIIDLPAYDMVRAWRDWQAEDDQIGLLEAEEKRLGVQEKIKIGLILGRLGGGAIVMGFSDGTPENEIDPDSIGEGDLQYLYPVHKTALKAGKIVDDPASPDFGEPESFELTLQGKPPIQIHRSRLLIFKGLFTGNLSALARGDYWGDAVVTSVLEVVNNATTVQNEFATLISQAKIDVFKIPNFMANMGKADYEQKFMRRVELSNVGKSNLRALMMDAEEEFEQRELTLVGMSDLARTYLYIVAGAADIPATRLLGKSPDGMNATGDSDQSNYEQMIQTKQKNELKPILEKLDLYLVPSALGSTPDEVYFEFAPLSVLSESDQAEVENKEADTLSKLTATGLFQDEALEEAFSNRMIESGRWPGYEKARTDAIKAAEAEPTPEDVTGVTNPPAPNDPNAPPAPGGTPPVHIHVGGGGANG